MKQYIIVSSVLVLVACGNDNHQQAPQYQQPVQPSPVVIQQAPSQDNALVTGVLVGGLGYMLGKSQNNPQVVQPHVIQKTIIRERIIERTPKEIVTPKTQEVVAPKPSFVPKQYYDVKSTNVGKVNPVVSKQTSLPPVSRSSTSSKK